MVAVKLIPFASLLWESELVVMVICSFRSLHFYGKVNRWQRLGSCCSLHFYGEVSWWWLLGLFHSLYFSVRM